MLFGIAKFERGLAAHKAELMIIKEEGQVHGQVCGVYNVHMWAMHNNIRPHEYDK